VRESGYRQDGEDKARNWRTMSSKDRKEVGDMSGGVDRRGLWVFEGLGAASRGDMIGYQAGCRMGAVICRLKVIEEDECMENRMATVKGSQWSCDYNKEDVVGLRRDKP